MSSPEQSPKQGNIETSASLVSPSTERGSERFSLGRIWSWMFYGGMIGDAIAGGMIGFRISETLLGAFGIPNDMRILPLTLGLYGGAAAGFLIGVKCKEMVINRWFKT